jgi:Rieske Fe-S protein
MAELEGTPYWHDSSSMPRFPALDRDLRVDVKENADYPYYMIRDRIAGPDAKTLREVGRGTGKILDLKGQRVAAYRNDSGQITLLSPVCTHMGCIVDWNEAESTWDCPCPDSALRASSRSRRSASREGGPGSRFKPTGEVLSGPAESPLEKRQ